MICENCGAEYRMKDVYCPFCQSENPVLAEILRDEALTRYDDEAQQMEATISRKAMKKWTRIILIICGILVGLALLSGIIPAIWAPISAKLNYRSHMRREQELEEMLVRQDIEGIYQALNGDDNVRDYPKFEEIWEVYSSYSSYQLYMEMWNQYEEETYRELYDESEVQAELQRLGDRLIWYAGRTLSHCRQYGSDRVIQGNEALFETYEKEICIQLKELGISEQLLQWLGRKQEDMEEDPRFQQAVNLLTESFNDKYYIH